jgi:hypothetical protein
MNIISLTFSTLFLVSNSAEASAQKIKPTAKVIPLSATLSDVVGDVQLNGMPAKNGDVIKIGSKLKTGEAGKVKALLGSGTVSVIGYNTQVVLEKNEIDSNKIETILLALQKGSVRYLVSEKGNSKIAMVRAGDAIGSTRGGEALFNCEGDCNDTAVTKKIPVKKVMKKVK